MRINSGSILASVNEFFHTERGSTVGWCLLALLGILAGYLSYLSTLSAVSQWNSATVFNATGASLLSISLNLTMLALSFGAWHEIRSGKNNIPSKAIWSLVLVFTFIWVCAPRSTTFGDLLIGIPAAIAFTALPVLLETVEDRLLGDRAEKRINRLVLHLGGFVTLSVVPVGLTFSALSSITEANAVLSHTSAVLLAGFGTCFVATSSIYGWSLIWSKQILEDGIKVIRHPFDRNTVVTFLISLMVTLMALIGIAVFTSTTLGGIGEATIKFEGTLGMTVFAWQLWIVLLGMATFGPLGLVRIEDWVSEMSNGGSFPQAGSEFEPSEATGAFEPTASTSMFEPAQSAEQNPDSEAENEGDNQP